MASSTNSTPRLFTAADEAAVMAKIMSLSAKYQYSSAAIAAIFNAMKKPASEQKPGVYLMVNMAADVERCLYVGATTRAIRTRVAQNHSYGKMVSWKTSDIIYIPLENVDFADKATTRLSMFELEEQYIEKIDTLNFFIGANTVSRSYSEKVKTNENKIKKPMRVGRVVVFKIGKKTDWAMSAKAITAKYPDISIEAAKKAFKKAKVVK